MAPDYQGNPFKAIAVKRSVLFARRETIFILNSQSAVRVTFTHAVSYSPSIAVFLNRRAAARYRALASIIPGRERFYWDLSF